jgi:hypothetical protein
VRSVRLGLICRSAFDNERRIEVDVRKTLISSGEHIGAIRRLGDDYTDAEYVEAITAARAAGDGTSFADACLGVDVDALLRGVEEDDGSAIVRAAESSLRRRGIDLKAASYAEYRAALVEVSA